MNEWGRTWHPSRSLLTVCREGKSSIYLIWEILSGPTSSVCVVIIYGFHHDGVQMACDVSLIIVVIMMIIFIYLLRTSGCADVYRYNTSFLVYGVAGLVLWLLVHPCTCIRNKYNDYMVPYNGIYRNSCGSNIYMWCGGITIKLSAYKKNKAEEDHARARCSPSHPSATLICQRVLWWFTLYDDVCCCVL